MSNDFKIKCVKEGLDVFEKIYGEVVVVGAYNRWLKQFPKKDVVAHCTKCGDPIKSDEDSLCGNCI